MLRTTPKTLGRARFVSTGVVLATLALLMGCGDSPGAARMQPGVYELHFGAAQVYKKMPGHEPQLIGLTRARFGPVDLSYSHGALVLKERKDGTEFRPTVGPNGAFALTIPAATGTQEITARILSPTRVEGRFVATDSRSAMSATGLFYLERLDNPELIDFPRNKNKTVATVNGKQIALADTMRVLGGSSVDLRATLSKGLKNLENVRAAVVCDLIDLELLRQAASAPGKDKAGGSATAPRGGDANLYQYMRGVLEVPESVDYLNRSDQARVLHYVSDEVDAGIVVDESAVQARFAKATKRPLKVKVARVSVILIGSKASSDQEREKARKKAQKILAMLKGGADFAALARRYSEDPSSGKRGGDMGEIPDTSVIDLKFRRAVFGTEKGTDRIVKTRFGYEIIRVVGLREVTQKAGGPTRDQVRAELRRERRGAAIRRLLGTLHQKAEVDQVTRACGLVPPVRVTHSM